MSGKIEKKKSEALNLGRFEYCLNVRDLQRSMKFYVKLGFKQIGGNPEEGWVVLKHNNLRLALYQEHIAGNLMNFRGGDVNEIARTLKNKDLKMKMDAIQESDGSMGATIEDPDGNLIYFNTHPDEVK
jgi:predicted lactoylglutathione lyase